MTPITTPVHYFAFILFNIKHVFNFTQCAIRRNPEVGEILLLLREFFGCAIGVVARVSWWKKTKIEQILTLDPATVPFKNQKNSLYLY